MDRYIHRYTDRYIDERQKKREGGRRETKEPGMVREGKLSHSFFQDCDESIRNVK